MHKLQKKYSTCSRDIIFEVFIFLANMIRTKNIEKIKRNVQINAVFLLLTDNFYDCGLVAIIFTKIIKEPFEMLIIVRYSLLIIILMRSLSLQFIIQLNLTIKSLTYKIKSLLASHQFFKHNQFQLWRLKSNDLCFALICLPSVFLFFLLHIFHVL